MPKSIQGAFGSAIVEPQSATRMRVRSANGAAPAGTFCASTRNVFVQGPAPGHVLTAFVSDPPLSTPTELDEIEIPEGHTFPSGSNGTQSVMTTPAGIPGPIAGLVAPGWLELVT